MKSHILIISNPASRRASEEVIKKAAGYLKQQGFSTEILSTTKRGDAEEYARNAVPQGPRMIISAGGDGTINEVINGLAFSGIPLGIIPLGTTNVLARELSLPKDLRRLLYAMIQSEAKEVSVGRISLNSNGAEVSRYFCLMAGLGFDGQAVRDVSPGSKKLSGPAAYFISGFRTLLHYNPQEMIINLNGKTITGYAAIIGNLSRYGGDFMVTPDARIEDPALYACIFQGKRRSDLLRYAFGVFFRRHLREPDVFYARTEEITILGTAPVQIDGDYAGTAPATISIAKNALRLLY